MKRSMVYLNTIIATLSLSISYFDILAVPNQSSVLIKNKNFVLISISGSGKGTFSEYLNKKYGYISISPGDIFRSEIHKQTEFGKKIQPIIEKGEYVDEETVRKIVVNNIFCILKQNKFFILESFPHSVESFKFLHKFFQKNNLTKDVCFIELCASDNECTKRILKRRICKNCSHIYNLSSAPPLTPNRCDYCKGKLFIRQSDTKENIPKRLAYFHAQTAPIKQAAKKFYIIKTIDTERPLKNLKKTYDKLILDMYSKEI